MLPVLAVGIDHGSHAPSALLVKSKAKILHPPVLKFSYDTELVLIVLKWPFEAGTKKISFSFRCQGSLTFSDAKDLLNFYFNDKLRVLIFTKPFCLKKLNQD